MNGVHGQSLQETTRSIRSPRRSLRIYIILYIYISRHRAPPKAHSNHRTPDADGNTSPILPQKRMFNTAVVAHNHTPKTHKVVSKQSSLHKQKSAPFARHTPTGPTERRLHYVPPPRHCCLPPLFHRDRHHRHSPLSFWKGWLPSLATRDRRPPRPSLAARPAIRFLKQIGMRQAARQS